MLWMTLAASLSLAAPLHRYSASTTWLTFDKFGPEETNVHMYELHLGFRPTPRDKVGIKAATWKLFAPMGIPLWDPKLMAESEFYPGRLQESGVGLIYQRLLWKGLFGQVEVLPLWKRYLDADGRKSAEGFKLYASYHLGYHIPLRKGRFFLEPQVHCNHWPIDTEGPEGFEAVERRWNDYFLFEPNLFFGVHF